MTKPSSDPSVDREPHLQGRSFEAAPPEAPVTGPVSRDELGAHSVWSEPALSPELAGAPSEADVTYASWLAERSRRTTWLGSWMTTLGLAVLAGPLAVLAALFHNRAAVPDLLGILTLVVFAPLVEELAKIMLPLICVETRPYRFRSRAQLFVACAIGGAVFAAIENVFYLRGSVLDFSEALTRWRWTVCVALHTGCSIVAGIGVARIWHATMTRQAPPQTALGAPCFAAAMVIHGVYNAFAAGFSLLYPF